MKEDWLDKSLENKLDNYESPMDLENAWSALQARREKPKKKKRFFFFWLLFGLLTIGAWVSYFILNNQSDTVSASKQESVSETITELGYQNENIENGFGKTTPNISAVADVEKIDSKNQVEKSESPTLKSTEDNINTSEKWKRGNQNYPPPTEEATLLSVATYSENEEGTFAKSKNNLSAKQQAGNTYTSGEEESFIENTPSIFVLPEEEKAVKPTLLEDSILVQKENQTFAFIPSFKMKLLDFPQSGEVEVMNNFEFTQKEMAELIKWNPKNTNLSSYFGLSVGYGTRSTGKVFRDENPLDLISFQAFYEKGFGKNFYFKTGINFDQMVNSFENSSEQILTDPRTNQLITVNHFQNGTTEDIFGMGEVSNLERTTNKDYHRYRLVSIPVIVGYEIKPFRKSTFQIEAGMARSVFTNYSGRTFELSDLDLQKQGVWQGVYGLSWNYKLRNRSRLFASVQGNYHFNEIGKSTQLDLEKFWFHQFQVGIKKHLR